ncbi:BRO family protein [uncultured Pseudomonas sp.]|uniref:BRO family protein n=1 Tax=uncultured Pseudomonas sp. TaxID=114707 RepID=UPI002592BDBB|nr:BRO family protein [uncultured Pseudomonas sp.]
MVIPVLFEFEALPVQVVTEDNGEHWSCARDICKALGYLDASAPKIRLARKCTAAIASRVPPSIFTSNKCNRRLTL